MPRSTPARVAAAPSPIDDAGRPAELVPLLAMIAKRTRALVNIALGELDLVVGQDQMLLALDPDRPIAVCDLAAALSVRASTVSKMLSIMSDKHFVARLEHGGDARKVHVVLTPAGLEMRGRIEALYERLDAEIGRAIGEERLAIVGSLDHLDRCLTARLRRLR